MHLVKKSDYSCSLQTVMPFPKVSFRVQHFTVAASYLNSTEESLKNKVLHRDLCLEASTPTTKGKAGSGLPLHKPKQNTVQFIEI